MIKRKGSKFYDYLKGELIQEPRTERQRTIPLNTLTTIDIDGVRLHNYIYG